MGVFILQFPPEISSGNRLSGDVIAWFGSIVCFRNNGAWSIFTQSPLKAMEQESPFLVFMQSLGEDEFL